MVRLLVVSPVAAILGIAGVAAADDAGIVDPWAVEMVESRGAAPFELSSELWIEVKQPITPVRASPLSARALPHHDAWAYVIDEIVYPWRRAGGVVARDPLIVDPWAR